VANVKLNQTFAKCYTSVVKSGERFSDEHSVLQFDQASSQMKILGPKCEQLKLYFPDGSEESKEQT
jgi:hypothetical protein